MNGSWKDPHPIQIIESQYVTHNVKRFRTTKPKGYEFIPGEATDIVINQPDWFGNRHAFTFTGLNDWDFLEFTIKIYKEKQGFTSHLDELVPGDELIIYDSFGAFHYRGTGTFIAGGSGVTPFIAILRSLAQKKELGNNRLFCSNRTGADIILKDEFEQMLGNHFTNVLTGGEDEAHHKRIDRDYLSKNITDFNQFFYICGKRKMMNDIKASLLDLGVSPESVLIEMEF